MIKKITPKKTYLFAYGTLMSNHGNNTLLKKSKFVGRAESVEKYEMYISKYGGAIPFVRKDKQTSIILGELWEINSECLKRLDALEGHPDWYNRESIDVKVNNVIVKAFIYFNQHVDDQNEGSNPMVVIETGDFNDKHNYVSIPQYRGRVKVLINNDVLTETDNLTDNLVNSDMSSLFNE